MDPNAPNHVSAVSSEWIAGILAILAVSGAFAWLLRRARFPGSAVVGGVVAGLALGPGVLGRAAPHLHDRLFGAAPAELAAWTEAERAIEATRFVAGQADVDPESAREQVESLVREAEARKAEWTAALDRARRPFLIATLALAAAMILATGIVRPAETIGGPSAAGRGLLLGAWNAFFPAALAAVALRSLGEPAWSPSMLATMAAVAAGAWPLAEEDRGPARESLPGGLAAARIAALLAIGIAIVLCGAAAWASSHRAAAIGTAIIGAALVAGVALGARIPNERKPMGAVVLLVPPLAALASLRIEPFLDVRWAPLIVLALIAEDGRWLGGILGAWLPGGIPFTHAMRIGILSIPATPAMLALVAVGLQGGFLAPAAGAGLLLGALLIETPVSVRRRFAADAGRREIDRDR